MDSFDCARRRILEVVARSPVPEDPRHAENTLEWLLRLERSADPALRLAALAHDIERARPDRLRREAFDDYDAFKAAHAQEGARILGDLLRRCGVEEAVAREACRLVERHESGGDPRSDLLREADSLSFFEVNLPLYHAREGDAETLRRCRWGVARLSSRGRARLAERLPADPALARIVERALRLEGGLPGSEPGEIRP